MPTADDLDDPESFVQGKHDDLDISQLTEGGADEATEEKPDDDKPAEE